jgi:inhibitor of cysteine peptidase
MQIQTPQSTQPIQPGQEPNMSLQSTTPKKNPNSKNLISIIFLSLLTIILLAVSYLKKDFIISLFEKTPIKPKLATKNSALKQFKSEEEFLSFIQNNLSDQVYTSMSRDFRMNVDQAAPVMEGKSIELPPAAGGGDRFSQTNVQVKNIDEPDIVKTDGQNIFLSSNQSFYYETRSSMEPAMEMMPPRYAQMQTNIISALPPETLEKITEITQGGELLLSGNILLIINENRNIFAYDLSEIKNPNKVWETTLEDNTYIKTTRLYQDQLYLLTSKYLDRSNPCPYYPLTQNGQKLEIMCTDIYYPNIQNADLNITYNLFKIDTKTGDINDKITFLASQDSSATYMSPDNFYFTYSYQGDVLAFIVEFFQKNGQDILPEIYLKRLEKLAGYDISNQAKLTELQVIFDEFRQNLDEDEMLRIDNDINNALEEYLTENAEQIDKTGIVKINLNKFEISATANVAGKPLNQFSLDEYQDHLRIATTVNPRFFYLGNVNIKSFSNLYVLDRKLKETGYITNLGKDERIYSVRFIADKGYLVTFKQIDPFFVLDLSNPDDPKVSGELKIPGYSSYLHPLTDELILGIGKEDSKVKISLFDVSDPSNPREKDKYTLDEYYSETLNNHHAFLQDEKYEIFFMPGGKGAYIFSYADDKLDLTKALKGYSTKRALFINDYLYIVSQDEINVFDETDWEKISTYKIEANSNPKTIKPLPADDEPRVFLKESISEPSFDN